jgi:hypothetical protein
MKKYLTVDNSTGLLLYISNHRSVSALLNEGLEDVHIRSIEPTHPFWSNANKTMMANKNFVVSKTKVIAESHESFSTTILGKAAVAQLRYPVLVRLLELVSNWIETHNTLIFPGMETVVEIALRDCSRTDGVYTAEINEYAEMLGMMPEEAYDQLNQLATKHQRVKLRGLAFINKYARMVNQSVEPEDLQKVNALMYEEWTEFQTH